jgi:hypothetical protein
MSGRGRGVNAIHCWDREAVAAFDARFDRPHTSAFRARILETVVHRQNRLKPDCRHRLLGTNLTSPSPYQVEQTV